MMRLWHTLSPLHPRQWHGRFRNLLQRVVDRFFLQRILQRGVTAVPTWRRVVPDVPWLGVDCDVDLTTRRFAFLSHAKTFPDRIDWCAEDCSYLWSFNLNYFEYLHSAGTDAIWVIEDWMEANPAPVRPAWSPYVTSLRIINWSKWLWSRKEPCPPTVALSIAHQANYLSTHLEQHLLANHLLENARALLFAAATLKVPAAHRWRSIAERILAKQLQEQVLDDGLHFERSWMYHGLLLVAYLDLVQLGKAGHLNGPLTDQAKMLSTRMAEALQRGYFSDDTYPLFKDAAHEIAPAPSAVLDYGTRVLDHQPTQRKQIANIDGFYLFRSGRVEWMVEAGPLSPDYNPGHAHADMLSFQLHLDAKPLIVDTATSTYDNGPDRHHERSSRAHNKVTVDGQNDSDVWSSFRVGRRARPKDVQWYVEGPLTVFKGSHDGYRSLRGKPSCRRIMLQWRDRLLIVLDHVSGGRHELESALHLAPGVAVESLAPDRMKVGDAHLVSLNGEPWQRHAVQHAPRFGMHLDNVRLSLVKSCTHGTDFGYMLYWDLAVTGVRYDSQGIHVALAESPDEIIFNRGGNGRWQVIS